MQQQEQGPPTNLIGSVQKLHFDARARWFGWRIQADVMRSNFDSPKVCSEKHQGGVKANGGVMVVGQVAFVIFLSEGQRIDDPTKKDKK